MLGRAQLIFKAWTFSGLFFPKISFIAAHVQVIFLYLHFMCMSKCYLFHSKAISWKYVINIEAECIISLDSCNPDHLIGSFQCQTFQNNWRNFNVCCYFFLLPFSCTLAPEVNLLLKVVNFYRCLIRCGKITTRPEFLCGIISKTHLVVFL